MIDPEALFISRKGQRLTVRSVERLEKKNAIASGADRDTSPHSLRRSYGTGLYEATQDLFAVATRLGHQSMQTAKDHYVRVSDDLDRRTADIKVFKESGETT